MSERLTRQELKEDPLLRETAHVAEFATKHVRLLVGAVVVVLVVVLAVVFIRGSAQRAEDRAADMLARALVDVEQGNLTTAAQRLEEVLEKSAGTASGRQGILVLGDIRYALGNYTEAERWYRQGADAFGDKGLESRVARQGLAATLENLGRNAEAADLYRGLADDVATPGSKADLLLSAARNFVRAGKTAEALAVYDQVAGDPTFGARAVEEAKLRRAEVALGAPGQAP